MTVNLEFRHLFCCHNEDQILELTGLFIFTFHLWKIIFSKVQLGTERSESTKTGDNPSVSPYLCFDSANRSCIRGMGKNIKSEQHLINCLRNKFKIDSPAGSKLSIRRR